MRLYSPVHWYADAHTGRHTNTNHREGRTAAATAALCLFLCARPVPMGGLSKPLLIHLISWTQEPALADKGLFHTCSRCLRLHVIPGICTSQKHSSAFPRPLCWLFTFPRLVLADKATGASIWSVSANCRVFVLCYFFSFHQCEITTGTLQRWTMRVPNCSAELDATLPLQWSKKKKKSLEFHTVHCYLKF